MKLLSAIILIPLACCALPAAEPALTPEAGNAPANSPLKVLTEVKPTFPARLLNSGIREGEARIMIEVDTKGVITDLLVTAYTSPEFAEEAAAALRMWTFAPATMAGKPVISLVEISFEFKSSGVIGLQNRVDDTAAGPKTLPDVFIYRPWTLRDLDSIPTPASIVPPAYPVSLRDQGVSGKVTVDFYIDEQGNVRMPSVVKADHPMLAGSALAAIMQWRFAPPLRSGQPVLVHTMQKFKFNPEK